MNLQSHSMKSVGEYDYHLSLVSAVPPLSCLHWYFSSLLTLDLCSLSPITNVCLNFRRTHAFPVQPAGYGLPALLRLNIDRGSCYLHAFWRNMNTWNCENTKLSGKHFLGMPEVPMDQHSPFWPTFGPPKKCFLLLAILDEFSYCGLNGATGETSAATESCSRSEPRKPRVLPYHHLTTNR